MDAAEHTVRLDLAAAYRAVAMYGWDDLVFTHISARVPGTHDFLINPYGLMFEEVTASTTSSSPSSTSSARSTSTRACSAWSR